ncbi:MAG TPA: ABC transporter permease [Victivallales bacterium]|nr:ABC transporter permease [Victivallales bacterium]
MAEKITKSDFEIVGNDILQSEKIYSQSMTYWQDAFRRIKKNKAAVWSFWVIVILVALCIFGPYINGYSFRNMDFSIASQWNWKIFMQGHFFGGDQFGRDEFTRVWLGGRVSFLIAITVVVSEGIIGTIYGGLAGLIGGKTDLIMMRIVEIFFVIPSIIYIILLMIVLGPGVLTIIIAMSTTSWLYMAMLIRGEVMKIKHNEYVMASQALGASRFRVLMKHLLPNCMGIIIVRLTLDIPTAIFTSAYLSFIGLGVPPPNASWGSLANNGYNQIYSAAFLFLIPIIMISITTLTFNILGDGLRDAMDPKLRK